MFEPTGIFGERSRGNSLTRKRKGGYENGKFGSGKKHNASSHRCITTDGVRNRIL